MVIVKMAVFDSFANEKRYVLRRSSVGVCSNTYGVITWSKVAFRRFSDNMKKRGKERGRFGMRSTLHNGRKHANGKAYNPKHNDRQFMVDCDENDWTVNYKKRQKNICWNWCNPTLANGKRREYPPAENERAEWAGGQPSFEETERRFYEEHFREGFEKTQSRYYEKRQYGRIRTFAEWREQNPPEEEWMQVGSVEEGTVTPEQFRRIYTEYIDWQMQWSREHGNPFTVVNYAMHFDEAVPHGQLRRVWHYVDDDGVEKPGQEKALEKAGVELPHPEKKKGRYNNRKQVFTEQCRTKWQEIIRSHGIVIVTEPRPKTSKKHMQQSLYWAEELSQRESDVSQRERIASERERQIANREGSLARREESLQEKIQRVSNREEAVKIREKQLDNREKGMVAEITEKARNLALKMADSDEIQQSSRHPDRRLPNMGF